MSYYSSHEIKEILETISQGLHKPTPQVKYTIFERLGVNNGAQDEIENEKIVLEGELANAICSVCNKKFISSRLLELHVEENHDSFFNILTNEKYACYLENCKSMFSTSEDRKDHCIKDHSFHKFRFEEGVAKKEHKTSSKLANKSASSSPSQQIANFHFGNKAQKTFKPNKGPTSFESMKDLSDNLPKLE